MAKSIRKGVFETNSSSTHSISVSLKEYPLDIPATIEFHLKEYGWEHAVLKTVQEKADYMFNAFLALNKISELRQIISHLKWNRNIQITVPDVTLKDLQPDMFESHVDHASELYEWIEFMCSDLCNAERFLFGPFSFVITGNDNQDSYHTKDIIEEMAKGKADIFFKGN